MVAQFRHGLPRQTSKYKYNYDEQIQIHMMCFQSSNDQRVRQDNYNERWWHNLDKVFLDRRANTNTNEIQTHNVYYTTIKPKTMTMKGGTIKTRPPLTDYEIQIQIQIQIYNVYYTMIKGQVKQ